ncbi:MAG: FKBP-type peptidyl-prolyl cis-trans isomerase [Deltaproteobacteria bacterium]|nr:FKBP-type peptidyl-prolyl cis-trans isomerase [Deltaproteobacteria bacterium]
MIRKWQGLAVLGVVLLAAQCAQEPTDLKTEKDKVSYGIGVSVAKNFKQQGVEVDMNMMIKGMKDELSGKKLLMSEDELRKTMTAYQQELRGKQMEQRKVAALDKKKEGDAFLAENKKKEGVVTTPSGLQYKILKAGEGKKPTADDEVEVNYRGTFIDGKEFDSSGGQPKTFKLTGIIPGWREALQLMPVGSKYQLVVPPGLAYGEQGMGQVIMPNTVLIFEVELVGIKSSETEAPKTEAPKEAPKK